MKLSSYLRGIVTALITVMCLGLSSASTVQNVSLEPAAVSPGLTTKCSVTLDAVAPTGGLFVTVKSNNSYVKVPPSFTVPAGKSVYTFTVTTDKSFVGWATISATGNGATRSVDILAASSGVFPGEVRVWSQIVSVSNRGIQGNDHSGQVPEMGEGSGRKISADGRFVVFTSKASNLGTVPDNNRKTDVFLRDRSLGTTIRISNSSVGGDANNNSYSPAISNDAKYIVFVSDATNIIANDANAHSDIFLYTVATKATTLISKSNQTGKVSGNGNSGQPSISGDGRFVAFASLASDLVTSDTNDCSDVFLFDLASGANSLVSKTSAGTIGNSDSDWPAISTNGKFVVFESVADNLVVNDNNEMQDIFVRDLTAGSTARTSLWNTSDELSGWSFGPAISQDGRYVLFSTFAPEAYSEGYAEAILRDRQNSSSINTYMNHYQDEDAFNFAFSDNDQFVTSVTGDLFSSSMPRTLNVFSAKSEHYTIYMDSTANLVPSISSDGRYVVCQSSRAQTPVDANGKIDVVVFDAAPQYPLGLTFDPNPGIYNGSRILAGRTYTGFVSLNQASRPDGYYLSFAGQSQTIAVPKGAYSAGATVTISSDKKGDYTIISQAASRARNQSIKIVQQTLAFSSPSYLTTSTAITGKVMIASVAPTGGKVITVGVYDPKDLVSPRFIDVTVPAGALEASFSFSVAAGGTARQLQFYDGFEFFYVDIVAP